MRRGRQYLREISGDGWNFGLPRKVGAEIRSVVPWSRIFNDQEMLLAINTDFNGNRAAWTIVDNDLHRAGERLKCSYSTDAAQIETEIEVREVRPGTKAVLVDVPAAGFVVYEQAS